MEEEYGVISKAVCCLDDEEMNIILELEIRLEEWGNCYMIFSPENSIKAIQLLVPVSKKWWQKKYVSELLGQQVKLLSHPKGGTYAPIAISQGLVKTWIYKKGWDQKCNGEPNEC